MSDSLTPEELNEFYWLQNYYQIEERCGYGTFSTVYRAVDLKASERDQEKRLVALKNITRTTAPSRVVEELRFLMQLNGNYNCIPLLSCYRCEDQIIAVFPHFVHTDFREFLEFYNELDIKHYIYNLLLAVRHVHSNKIIHRDIKPSNFLYNKEEKRGWLIDFGLAQFYEKKSKTEKENVDTRRPSVLFYNTAISKQTKPPGYVLGDNRPQMKANRGGTRGFRAPEVLFRHQDQTPEIDIWSVGVIFLIILTRQYPFFNSMDDKDGLVEIACIFGHNNMKKLARHLSRNWKSNIPTVPLDQVPFERLINNLNPSSCFSAETYDLLYRMLELYPEKRISAEDALKHPFFKGV